MIGWTYSEFIAALAGLAGGVIIGAAIITPTEAKIRQLQTRPASGALRVFLSAIFRVIVVAILFAAVVFIILRLSGVGALKGHLYTIFSFAGLAGVAAGKYARYLYWIRLPD